MRLSLAILLAAMFSLPAIANDGPCSEQLPPAKYASMPAPEHEIVQVSSQRELQQACGHPFTMMACALNDRPLIYMLGDRQIADIAGDYHRGKRWKICLVAHEIAHLNGWRH